jgi:ABC-2 type transport system ATP-binding protein
VIRDGRILADLPTGELLEQVREDRYEIRVAGTVGALPGGLPSGTQLEAADGTTRIMIPSADPDTLALLLNRLEWRETPLLSVNRARPDLEEVFLRLVRDGASDG